MSFKYLPQNKILSKCIHKQHSSTPIWSTMNSVCLTNILNAQLSNYVNIRYTQSEKFLQNLILQPKVSSTDLKDISWFQKILVWWYPITDKLTVQLKPNYTNFGMLITNLFRALPFSSKSGYGFYTAYQLQRLFNIKWVYRITVDEL